VFARQGAMTSLLALHTATTATVLLLACHSGEVRAQQTPLPKVQIIAATPILDVSYSQLNLPLTLGYWRD
jgi:hypothetical protein